MNGTFIIIKGKTGSLERPFSIPGDDLFNSTKEFQFILFTQECFWSDHKLIAIWKWGSLRTTCSITFCACKLKYKYIYIYKYFNIVEFSVTNKYIKTVQLRCIA